MYFYEKLNKLQTGYKQRRFTAYSQSRSNHSEYAQNQRQEKNSEHSQRKVIHN